jgi:DMSO/TMAO reductase YedYZ heme-binding membrane subunit
MRAERLPADSGEWPRVKYRPLNRATPGISRARYAGATAAGVLVWPLPFLLLLWDSVTGDISFAGELVLALVLFPVHVGVAVTLVAGIKVTIETRTTVAIQSLIATGACLALAAFLFVLPHFGVHESMLCIAVILFGLIFSVPGALLGVWLGGLMVRAVASLAELRHPTHFEPHAGAVPYYYPRTKRRPRHG